MEKVLEYSNGLRLTVEHIPSVRSVAIGIWVGVGSSRETAHDNGLSHFIEHMLFKGTDTMSAYDIAKNFEGMGAAVNAFTGKECTCYHVKSIDSDADNCFKLLCDIFFRSAFDPVELDKERMVVDEEINMSEDSPEDICYDLIAETVYKNHPLGQTILGPADNVKRFSREDIKRFMVQFYCPTNTVVSMAGNISLRDADKLVKKYFLGGFSGAPCIADHAAKHDIVTGFGKRVKDFEQSNIAISYPSVPFNHPLGMTQSVMNILLGGGMSSRLFQSIRERQGLAYSVYSSASSYKNNGNMSVYLNISRPNTQRAVETVRDELKLLVGEGVNAEEFERAKAQLKATCVFAQESVQTIMYSLGKLMVLAGELYDIDKKIAEIDAVTMDGVNEFARKIFTQDSVCAAYVGKEDDTDILGILIG